MYVLLFSWLMMFLLSLLHACCGQLLQPSCDVRAQLGEKVLPPLTARYWVKAYVTAVPKVNE